MRQNIITFCQQYHRMQPSRACRAVCTFPTFYCPKVSRFDVSCNRPLRFSRAVGDNWRHHRRNISEHAPCNTLTCHSAYQNSSLNWFNWLSFLPPLSSRERNLFGYFLKIDDSYHTFFSNALFINLKFKSIIWINSNIMEILLLSILTFL